MTATEFQIEPGIRVIPTDDSRDKQVYHRDPEHLQSGIESLALGLQFRDWLSDHERNLLDMVAPEHAVTFLLHRDRYLHPEDVPLFPVDLIETSLHQGGEAIFIQRYEPTSGYGSDCYKILTARVGRSHGDDLILGILGPDRLSGPSRHEDYFGRLVAIFRRAWKTSRDAAVQLGSRLNNEQPMVLVNRASGRVITVSEKLPELLGSATREITGIESGELLARVQRLDRNARFQLENISLGSLHLCLGRIKLSPGSAPGGARLSANCERFLIHAVRNRLTAISAASGHLDSIVGDRITPEEHEFLTIIQNEVLATDRHLQRLKLLSDYAAMKSAPLSLARELDYGLNAVQCEIGDEAIIAWAGTETTATVRAVPGSLQSLFDAVIRSHTTNMRSSSRTTVVTTDDGHGIHVCFETPQAEQHGNQTMNRDWVAYADNLAALMGARVVRSGDAGETFMTTITLTVEPESATTGQ